MNSTKTVRKNEDKMTRMRTKPKLTDYCFITTRKHLKTLKQAIFLAKVGTQQVNILDIGCGTKPFLSLFEGLNINYVGIDVSIDTQADIIQSLEEPLQIESDSIDLIIASEVLEHVFEFKNVLNEAKRVLKKDGIIYISTPYAFPIHARPYDFFRYSQYFYTEFAEKNRLKLTNLTPTNSIFTTPIYTCLQILMPLPLIPSFIKGCAYALSNIMILAIDRMSSSLFSKTKYSDFANSFPAGYSLIYKNCD